MSYKNTFGQIFRIHTFGESHGPSMGLVVDGCPSGIGIDLEKIRSFMNRRRPGQNEYVTSRNESDDFQILSGLFESKTLGTPIGCQIPNTNQKSSDYSNLEPRKGHADQAWIDKFDHVDLRGGGRSSGRETVCRVFAGAIARQALEELAPQLQIHVWIDSVGPIKNRKSHREFSRKFDNYKGLNSELGFPDEDQIGSLKTMLTEAKVQGESYGGVIKFKISHLDSGLGQPVFSKLKSDFASAMFSIGSVQGFILGEDNVHLSGTEFHKLPNPYGGIQGGISTSQPIECDVLIKPTSTIGEAAKAGRHDPCIMPRALVVVESMLSMVLLDHYLMMRMDKL